MISYGHDSLSLQQLVWCAGWYFCSFAKLGWRQLTCNHCKPCVGVCLYQVSSRVSACKEVLTYTGVVVGCQLEASIALAVIGTRSVYTSMVAIRRQGAFVYIWVSKKEKWVWMESHTFPAAVLPNCKVKWTWLKAEKSLCGLDIASTDLNGHAALPFLFINFLSLFQWLSSSHYYQYIRPFYFLVPQYWSYLLFCIGRTQNVSFSFSKPTMSHDHAECWPAQWLQLMAHFFNPKILMQHA